MSDRARLLSLELHQVELLSQLLLVGATDLCVLNVKASYNVVIGMRVLGNKSYLGEKCMQRKSLRLRNPWALPETPSTH